MGDLVILNEKVKACTRCEELAKTRTNIVFGDGNPKARIFLIGEAPGADEDAQGLPFVGKAGVLLTNILTACKLTRDDVYIANILKCRPPKNRDPLPEEAANCREYLDGQIDFVKPEFIVCLGRVAAQNLLRTETIISELRGKWHDYNGIKVLCTYHPAYLIRNPSAKESVWKDLQLLLKALSR